MATHVLWQADVADFDAWLKVFREDKPMRKAAGIRDLHVWRDPDQKDHAIAMFEVINPTRPKHSSDPRNWRCTMNAAVSRISRSSCWNPFDNRYSRPARSGRGSAGTSGRFRRI